MAMTRRAPPLQRRPPPFAAVHADYDDALRAVLDAANMLSVAIDAALKLGQVRRVPS